MTRIWKLSPGLDLLSHLFHDHQLGRITLNATQELRKGAAGRSTIRKL
jgi:hypothetical protein